MSSTDIDSTLNEVRRFEPPIDFASKAHVKSLTEYEAIYKRAAETPEEFWADIAKELTWFKPWDKVLEWKPPFAKWFVGGQTNISYNCLDLQIARGRGDHTAILWEGEPVEQ